MKETNDKMISWRGSSYQSNESVQCDKDGVSKLAVWEGEGSVGQS